MSIEEQFIGAVRSGDSPQIEAMLRDLPTLADSYADDGTSAVLTALYSGHTALAMRIAQSRSTPITLVEAAALNDTSRINEILDLNPAEVSGLSTDGFTPLHLAAYFGNIPAVDLLLKRGALASVRSDNSMGVLPIHAAVAHPNEDAAHGIAALLIDAHHDVNVSQRGGFTPLMAAAENGHERVVTLLLSRGADRSAVNDEGRSARDLAAAAGHAWLVAML